MSLSNIIHQFPHSVRSLIDEIEQEWCETIEELYPDLELPELPKRVKRSDYLQLQKQVEADHVLEDWPDLELPDLPPDLPEVIPGVTPLDELPGIYGTGGYWMNRILLLLVENIKVELPPGYVVAPVDYLKDKVSDQITVVPNFERLIAFFDELLYLEVEYSITGLDGSKGYNFRGMSTHGRNSGMLVEIIMFYIPNVIDNSYSVSPAVLANNVWEHFKEAFVIKSEAQSINSL